jgi:ATPase subunit of ABC transporter with duplicated ATPase domains
MTAALLDVRALEAGYSSAIVGPATFQVTAGEVLGLVGPNGSGKTTLLKAIADSARIFSGEICREAGLTIAWMEQQALRLAEMPFSGREFLRFAEADEASPPAQMLDWLDQRIDSLSGGQFQLLRCWAALASEARLVMLDEPTNNLDIDSEQALAAALTREYRGRGVLLVSHDRAFLRHVCDRVLDVEQWASS